MPLRVVRLGGLTRVRLSVSRPPSKVKQAIVAVEALGRDVLDRGRVEVHDQPGANDALTEIPGEGIGTGRALQIVAVGVVADDDVESFFASAI